MPKTIDEINERISKGQTVVCDAEEILDTSNEEGTNKAAAEVDVVTTGTFLSRSLRQFIKDQEAKKNVQRRNKIK